MSFSWLVTLVVLVIVGSVFFVWANRTPVPNVENDRDVVRIAKNGDRVMAIKAYRQLHGVGVKEATAELDAMLFNEEGN